MFWLIYTEYNNRMANNLMILKNTKWYIWLIFIAMLIVLTILYIAFLIFVKVWIVASIILCAIGTGAFLGYHLKKVKERLYGSIVDQFHRNIHMLIEILIEYNVYNHDKIEKIIEQVNNELPSYEYSKSIIKRLVTFLTLFLPIVSLILTWILDSYDEGMIFVLLLVAIFLMFFGIYISLKPLIEEILDSEHRKLKRFKNALEDIVIKEFL